MSDNQRKPNTNGILARIFSSAASAIILDFFIGHKEFDYSLTEIANKTGLSFRTLVKEIPNLEQTGLIIKHRKVAKANMYRLDIDNEAIAILEKLVINLSQMPFMKKTQDIKEYHIPIDEITETKP